jgi:hypothetical protein
MEPGFQLINELPVHKYLENLLDVINTSIDDSGLCQNCRLLVPPDTSVFISNLVISATANRHDLWQ